MKHFSNAAAEQVYRWSTVALSVLFNGAAAALVAKLVYRLYHDQEIAWSFLVAIAICLVAGRISEVVSLEFGLKGLKAELATKVKEVEATLAQLHQIAKPWAIISTEQICSDGRWGGIDRRSKARQLADIIETLRALGSPGLEQVEAVSFKWDRYDYVARILRLALDGPEEGCREAYEAYYEAHKDVADAAGSPEIETLLDKYGRNSGDAAMWLEDYKYFELNKRHRRPAAWFAKEHE